MEGLFDEDEGDDKGQLRAWSINHKLHWSSENETQEQHKKIVNTKGLVRSVRKSP